MREMVSVAEAREIVLDHGVQRSAEHVRLGEVVGRVLAEPITSHEDIPPFDNSAMDGYAVRLGDLERLPASLTVSFDIPAGADPGGELEAGQCARIMTGAMIPPGAEAVVPVEWTDGFKRLGEKVSISRKPDPGQHVRRAGEDVAAGASVLSQGTTIRASMIGTLASLGYGQVPVSKRPTVSVIATGSELVEAGSPLRPGTIRNSNGPSLGALVTSAGGELAGLHAARDDLDQTRSVLERAAHADILIVSGGVSVGAHDFVRQVLEEMGTEILFWRVRQKPGKPLTFGTMSSTAVFGLPGNPVSTTVCFYQYVYPLISKVLGRSTDRELRRALLTTTLQKRTGLYHFIGGISQIDPEGTLCVSRSGPQGSHVYSSIAKANCLIHLDEDLDRSPELGSLVDVEPFPA